MNIALLKRKMRSDSRLVKLEPYDEDKAERSLIDPSIYKGGNNMRIMKNPDTRLWQFRYKHGFVPPSLKGLSFTRFNDALDHVTRYFEKQGLRVVGVEDLWDSE